jgi:hypothetical protein
VAADVLLLLRLTESPPEAAALVRVTVPVEAVPPDTVVGDTDTDATVGALTVSVAVCCEPLMLAVMVTLALAATAKVETVNVPVAEPDDTVIVGLTVAAAVLLLERATDASVVGAELSVTVPVLGVPPVTVVGLSVREVIVCGVTVNEVVFVVLLSVALSVTTVLVETLLVLTVAVAVVAPWDTGTLDWIVAAAVVSLERLTLVPPVGAAEPRVTVAVEVCPPATEFGDTEMLDKMGAVTVKGALALDEL